MCKLYHNIYFENLLERNIYSEILLKRNDGMHKHHD